MVKLGKIRDFENSARSGGSWQKKHPCSFLFTFQGKGRRTMSHPQKSILKKGDFITLQSKNKSENFDGCIFEVKSKLSSSGWLGFDVTSIDGNLVKRADKGLKPSGAYEQDYLFLPSKSQSKVNVLDFYSFHDDAAFELAVHQGGVSMTDVEAQAKHGPSESRVNDEVS